MRARTYDRYARTGMFLGPDRVIVSATSYACVLHTCVSRNTSGERMCARSYRSISRLFIENFPIFRRLVLFCNQKFLQSTREQNVKNDLKEKNRGDISIAIFINQNEYKNEKNITLEIKEKNNAVQLYEQKLCSMCATLSKRAKFRYLRFLMIRH